MPSFAAVSTISASQVAAGAWLFSCLAIVLWLPGLLALEWAGSDRRGYERLAWAFGLSVCLWPVGLLWSTWLHVRWTAQGLWVVVAIGLVWLLFPAFMHVRQGLRSASRRCLVSAEGTAALRVAAESTSGVAAESTNEVAAESTSGVAAFRMPSLSADGAALACLLVLTAYVRLRQIDGILVPPWVDGLHHTIIAQTILEQGAVPTDLRPYLEVTGFYYHFGFHTLAAAFSFLSGAKISDAVLWMGQALNAGAVLTTYAFAMRLVDRPVAALAGSAVPATLYWFPAYFVSWSRFTQLAGLVALPVAWLVVWDASRRPGRRMLVVASLAAAGLLLVHYRVFAFFCLGVLVIVGRDLLVRRDARATRRMFAIAVAGGLSVAPWLFGNLWSGIRSMAASSDRWYVGPEPASVNALPDWLFTTHTNQLWLALAGLGLFIGLFRRRSAALAVVLGLGLALLAVNPSWLGLPETWFLPRFSLAISAHLPIAVGVAMLVAAVYQRLDPSGIDRPMRHMALLFCLLFALAGATKMFSIVNQDTIMVTEADVAAADWIRTHTPAGARFLVATTAWQMGAFRGLDGGYWLPILAGRATNIPPALYFYGTADSVKRITELSQAVGRGDALSDTEMNALMARAEAGYIYVGPRGDKVAGKFTAARMQRNPELEQVYADGGAYVFRRRSVVP